MAHEPITDRILIYNFKGKFLATQRCSFYPNVTMLRSGVCYRNQFLYVVCLSSITFVHPIQSVKIFCNVSTPSMHPVTSIQNFTKIVRGKPLGWGLNARGVDKYGDFGSDEGYISEIVQDTASGTIYD